MKKLFPVAALLLLSFLSASTAHAVGLGIYGSLGRGSADWEAPGSFYSGYSAFSTDSTHQAFGLALDTHLSGERLFNYHVSLGYDTFTLQDFLVVPYNYSGTPSVPLQTDLDMKGFVWSHAFGFGGQIAPRIRLWIGPELRFQWAKGKPAPSVDVKMFGAGIGPVVGINMNISRRLTLALKAGYQFMTYDADVSGMIAPTVSASRNYDIDEKLLYLNLELFVRSLGDR